MKSLSPTRPGQASTSLAPFPLSRIHRLLRPLRAHLSALHSLLASQEARSKDKERLEKERKQGGKTRIYEESKRGGKRKWEEAEYGSSASSVNGGRASSSKAAGSAKAGRKKYSGARKAGSTKPSLSSHLLSSPHRFLSQRPATSAPDVVGSSPIFKGLSSMTARVRTTYGRRLLRQPTTWAALGSTKPGHTAGAGPRVMSMEESAVREKVDKVVEAYANVLDAVLETEHLPTSRSAGQAMANRVDALGTMAARVVGRMLERWVAEEVDRIATSSASSSRSTPYEDSSLPEGEDEDGEEGRGERETCLKEDEETRAALVDECHVLGQHALMLIIRSFPVPALSSPSTSSHPSHLTHLYTSLNDLHLPFGPLARPFACLLVPPLLGLSLARCQPSIRSLWESYKDHYGAKADFLGEVRRWIDGSDPDSDADGGSRGWEGWKGEEVGSLVRFAPEELVLPAFEAFFSARSDLVVRRNSAGLADETDDERDRVQELEDDSAETLESFLDSLVLACLPSHTTTLPSEATPPFGSDTSTLARSQLAQLSRLVFDAVTSRTKSASRMLVELAMTIEAHRLALALPCLTPTGEALVPGEDEARSPGPRLSPAKSGPVGPPHRPIRLQALLALALPMSLFSDDQDDVASDPVEAAAKRFLHVHRDTRLMAVTGSKADEAMSDDGSDDGAIRGLEAFLENLCDARYALRTFATAIVDVLLKSDKGSYFLEVADGSGKKERRWLTLWARRFTGVDDGDETEVEEEVEDEGPRRWKGKRARRGDATSDRNDSYSDEAADAVTAVVAADRPGSRSSSVSQDEDEDSFESGRPAKRKRTVQQPRAGLTSDATFVPDMLDTSPGQSRATPMSKAPHSPGQASSPFRSSHNAFPFAFTNSQASREPSKKGRSPERRVEKPPSALPPATTAAPASSASPVASASTSRHSQNDSGYGSRSPVRVASAQEKTPSPEVSRKKRKVAVVIPSAVPSLRPSKKTSKPEPEPEPQPAENMGLDDEDDEVIFVGASPPKVQVQARKRKLSDAKPNAKGKSRRTRADDFPRFGCFKRSGSEEDEPSLSRIGAKKAPERRPTPHASGTVGHEGEAPPLPDLTVFYAAYGGEDNDDDELDFLGGASKLYGS